MRNVNSVVKSRYLSGMKR